MFFDVFLLFRHFAVLRKDPQFMLTILRNNKNILSLPTPTNFNKVKKNVLKIFTYVKNCNKLLFEF
jgi:hypothetical protein